MGTKSDEFFSKLNTLCDEYQVEINAADDGNGELARPVIEFTIQDPYVCVEVLSVDDHGVQFARDST